MVKSLSLSSSLAFSSVTYSQRLTWLNSHLPRKTSGRVTEVCMPHDSLSRLVLSTGLFSSSWDRVAWGVKRDVAAFTEPVDGPWRFLLRGLNLLNPSVPWTHDFPFHVRSGQRWTYDFTQSRFSFPKGVWWLRNDHDPGLWPKPGFQILCPARFCLLLGVPSLTV